MDINNISYHRNSNLLSAKPNSDDGITIIHCSDIHLGAEIPFLKHNDAKKRRHEIMTTFRKITEMCNEKAVDLLIIAGDLFENHGIDLSIINTAKRYLADIPNTIVAICGGNHDYLSADCPLSDNDWSDNVFIFGKELQYVEFPNMKLRLWGTSFTRTYIETPIFDSIQVPFDSYTNILVMHGDLLLKENQISRYNPITLEQLGKSKMDYVALGHIHLTTPIQKVEDTYYAYSGCPEGHGFDEQGKKGIYFGTIAKNKVDLQFIPISQRMLIETNVDISGCYSDDEALSKIKDFINKTFGDTYMENFYKITLVGLINERYRPNVQYIQSILSEIVFYIDVLNASLPNIDFDSISKEFSLKGIFVKNMLNRIDRCNDSFEKENLKDALYIGLNAFEKEVAPLDN
ncbi:MAG: DNA repair exonuclease [Ruminococcus sp.]|nr:DNA repair exonuclease [Ruminococcus sp.]